MNRFFDASSVSQDTENSVILFTVFDCDQQGNFDKVRGYMVHTQKVSRDTVQASSLWFLPHTQGYIAACDHVISERQRIWGDMAP